MRYYYDVSYSIFEQGVLYKAGTLGLMHDKKCINTTIKAFIKKMLPLEKRGFEIVIISSELISEEEAMRRFGMNILNVRFKHRLVR